MVFKRMNKEAPTSGGRVGKNLGRIGELGKNEVIIQLEAIKEGSV